jgi:hypothetical protein
VCIGARLVWQAACDDALGSSLKAWLEAQIQKARLAVRKAELIAHYYDELSAARTPRRTGAWGDRIVDWGS